MKEHLDNIAQEMCEGVTSFEGIRQSARSMFDVASCNYTGYLLKAAMNMISEILQFANDLEHPPERRRGDDNSD